MYKYQVILPGNPVRYDPLSDDYFMFDVVLNNYLMNLPAIITYHECLFYLIKLLGKITW